jgi:hypothetical protein
MIPAVIIPMTFLFILLIILISKSPKTGAWILGGLIFVVPLLLFSRFAAGGPRPGVGMGPAALPLLIIPLTFVFILLVVLLTKAPKAGVGLIVALVVMGVLGVFFATAVTHRRPTHAVSVPPLPRTPERRAPVPVTPAPIWSAGLEKEMDAEVYPSKLAALRVFGARVDKAVRELGSDSNSPAQITLFQEELERTLVVELKNAIQQALSQVTCVIEAEPRNLRPEEVGVTVRLVDVDVQHAPWTRVAEVRTNNTGLSAVSRVAVGAQSPESAAVRTPESAAFQAASGRLELDVFNSVKHVTAHRQFVEKPWVEDFATFASTRPQQAFIIARSLGTCTSEAEANQQALDDARARLEEAIVNQRGPKPGPPGPSWSMTPVTATDVLQGGFIADRFAQSFEGSVGKIWRQALLIDVSGSKLAQLSRAKITEFREVRMGWARMGLSAVGVIVLIGVIYFFLNMATMGYYEWSLRIAGVVLAIVAVISVLMVVR